VVVTDWFAGSGGSECMWEYAATLQYLASAIWLNDELLACEGAETVWESNGNELGLKSLEMVRRRKENNARHFVWTVIPPYMIFIM
jgi:hypothetical protein